MSPAPAGLPLTGSRLHGLHGLHELAFEVRDSECDMGQVVNNAVYLQYLEHARHALLRGLGIHFGDLARRGIFLVVARVEADFLASLTSGDHFVVRTELQRQGRLRLRFVQQVLRSPDQRLMLSAIVTGTAVNQRGRPAMPAELDALLTQTAS